MEITFYYSVYLSDNRIDWISKIPALNELHAKKQAWEYWEYTFKEIIDVAPDFEPPYNRDSFFIVKEVKKFDFVK